MTSCYLRVMAKKTYTYATEAKTKEAAAKKAKKEGITLSEKINNMLVAYTAKPKKTVLVFGNESFELK